MRPHKKISLIAYSFSFVLALLPALGNALDLTIEPRVQAGIMDYEFEQKASTTPGGAIDQGFKLVSSMPFLGVGSTLFVNQFFFDLYVQKAFSGSDSATNRLDTEKKSFDFIVDSDHERDEFSLSTGYSLGSQWVVFGGYRKVRTQFNNKDAYREELAKNQFFVMDAKYKSSFDQDGFFFGSTYALPIKKHSIIAFNIAFAVLDGKYDSRRRLKLKGVNQEGEVLIDPDDGKPIEATVDAGAVLDGDTLGLNLGVSWKGRIGEKVGYSLGVNGYNYDFDNKGGEKESYQTDLSERVLRFSGGLSYQF
jgi:hypothetical protein